MKLTIYHDGQFFVGVVEEDDGDKLRACRYVFGPEPADADVLKFVNRRMIPLMERVSQEVEVKNSGTHKRINPKRRIREAAKETKKRGISTYAQQVLQLEREQNKEKKKTISREYREELKKKKREIAVKKAKEKHRGR